MESSSRYGLDLQRPELRQRQALKIFKAYKERYPLPLSEYLKHHFRNNKQAGSRDRREIRDLLFLALRIAGSRSLEVEHVLQLIIEDQSFSHQESSQYRYHHLLSPAIDADAFLEHQETRPSTWVCGSK